MGRGNNHRHDCGCGWCISTWESAGIDRGAIRRTFAQQDALRVLRESRAGDARAKCFVNPNAQCPVCGAAVFFYQNSLGSRVYFDQLGPPWPKHPCTNILRAQTPGTAIQRPAARGRGERIELIGAARQVRKYEEVRVAPAGYPIDWQMVEILHLKRTATKNLIIGRLLQQAREDLPVHFSVDDKGRLFETGDVVSACFSHVSFFDMTAFTVRSLAVHWHHDESYTSLIQVADLTIDNAPGVSPQVSTNPRHVRGSMTLIRREHAPSWLKRSVENHRSKPNTRKRKSKKKVTTAQKQPARLAVTASRQVPPESSLDREKMHELLSQRFKIIPRKGE